MGRCNRRAECANAEILWLDVQPKDDKDPLRQPYAAQDLDQARTALKDLSDASPKSLGSITVAGTPEIRPVIRRRDLLDLFDTTPDVCGQDLDVSRYIRDAEDSDVQFFWRVVDDEAPPAEAPPPHRNELCRVSIADASKFLKQDKTRAWRWDPLYEKWQSARSARPGVVYLVDIKSGGYCDTRGWTGDARDQPTPLPSAPGESEAHADEPLTFTRAWQTLADHTAQVSAEMDVIAAALPGDPGFFEALLTAAHWHDVGKAHHHFQQMLADGPQPPPEPDTVYAKSGNTPVRRSAQTPYRSIRHELASALAWLLAGPADAPERDLVAYLIAAHHGKIRLSIRSLPTESGDPTEPDRLFARGIWHGDTLPPVILPGLSLPETTLDLSFMHLGEGPQGPSWLARTLTLRDRLGPFRLAFLEMVLRAADARASALASSPEKQPSHAG
jgi:CRISPR-associated endonuclease/helicase Cas3